MIHYTGLYEYIIVKNTYCNLRARLRNQYKKQSQKVDGCPLRRDNTFVLDHLHNLH
jgi:hypothetical protein